MHKQHQLLANRKAFLNSPGELARNNGKSVGNIHITYILVASEFVHSQLYCFTNLAVAAHYTCISATR